MLNSVGRCEKGICRSSNEDAIFIFNTQYGCLPNLYIVADGMGGHNAGEVASSSAIQFFCEYIHENRMRRLNQNYECFDVIKEAILYANKRIYNDSKSSINLAGMGTTFIVASMFNNRLLVENVGDSRLYLIRDNEIIQITIDHTYVMEMLKSGNLTEEELFNHPNKNVITRAVGTQENLEVDTFEIELHANDIVLMCSDGLSNMIKDDDLLKIIQSQRDINVSVQTLLDRANENGGLDNISIILINNFFGEVS